MARGRPKGPSKKPKKASKKEATEKESKEKYALKITDNSKGGYLEFNPEGKDCVIFVDEPNKVGKTMRIRQIGKVGGTVSIKIAHRDPIKIESKMKFIDLVKSTNVWQVIPRFN